VCVCDWQNGTMVALRVVTFVSTLVLLISAGWVQSKGVNAKKDEKEDVMVLFNVRFGHDFMIWHAGLNCVG